MSYQIINTLNGPIVYYDGVYVTLLEHHTLIDIAEAHPQILQELQSSIAVGIRDGADEAIDAMYSNLQVYQAKLNSYLVASSQYLAFIQTSWYPYQTAKADEI
mgnify:CR=1 FL=1